MNVIPSERRLSVASRGIFCVACSSKSAGKHKIPSTSLPHPIKRNNGVCWGTPVRFGRDDVPQTSGYTNSGIALPWRLSSAQLPSLTQGLSEGAPGRKASAPGAGRKGQQTISGF